MTGAAPNPLQPAWKQGGKDPGSTEAIVYRVSKGEQAGQRVVGLTDEGVEVSMPHCPYVNMLDPSGHVCAVVISPNRDLAQADQKYRHVTVTIRLRKGWVVWDHDPMVHMGVTAEQWAVRRLELQEKGQRAAKKSSARYNAMNNDKVADLLQVVADDHALMSKLAARLEAGDLAGAEKIAAGAKQPKGKDAGGG